MAARDAALIDVRDDIARTLKRVDQLGLVDAGILLNDALLALEREIAAVASRETVA